MSKNYNIHPREGLWVAIAALALSAVLGLMELRAITARIQVCVELLDHRDARYVGPPEVCEVPRGDD